MTRVKGANKIVRNKRRRQQAERGGKRRRSFSFDAFCHDCFWIEVFLLLEV